ncbi:transcription elongation factor GreA, partial [Streptococcus pneumoniae]
MLFENLFKPGQRRLVVCMVTDFVSSIHNLKTV